MSRRSIRGRRGPGWLEQLECRRLLSGVEGTDFGDAPDSYGTTLANNGAFHWASLGLLLGQHVDIEADGQPSVLADGDDLNGILDDEDGVQFLSPLTPGGIAMIEVTNGASPGWLNAWIDFGRDGRFHPQDQIIIDRLLPMTSVTLFNIPIPGWASIGTTYARFRLSDAPGCPPVGGFGIGEVEDYHVRILGADDAMDFGDAPDFPGSPFSYPTTFSGVSGNPARHVIVPGAPMLGFTIDAELDGQPTVFADGDDQSGIDDEDGVMLAGMPLNFAPLIAGALNPIEITNGGGAPGFVNAWFDWNEDGHWDPATEQEIFDLLIPPGATVAFDIFVPGHLTANSNVYSRFRISSTPGLSPQGFAPDGEVEDYRNRVIPDTHPPFVMQGTLEYETWQAVTLTFNEPLNPLTVSPADLMAQNTDDGNLFNAHTVILTNNNTEATWVFNMPGMLLSDGDYQFVLPPGSVSDVAGNPMAANYVLSGPSIYILAGDADRNRVVNLNDFNILAANFGQSPRTFSQGDFNYDGVVNLLDFNILASNFGSSTRPGVPTEPEMFGSKPIQSDDSDELARLLS